MKITNVIITKVDSPTRLRGYAAITIDNDFVIHDIKIIEDKDKIFIAMPSKKCPDGTFRDVAHPINAETREKIQNAIIEEFNKE